MNSAFSIASACMCCVFPPCALQGQQKQIAQKFLIKKYCYFCCWSMCVLMEITNRKKGGKQHENRKSPTTTNERTNECLENLCTKKCIQKNLPEAAKIKKKTSK